MTLTVAPGRTAPDGSLTLPRIRPKLPCENTAREESNTSRVMSRYRVTPDFNATDVILFSISYAPHDIRQQHCIILQVVIGWVYRLARDACISRMEGISG